MLKLFYSNRLEALTEALLDQLGQAVPGPWVSETVIVPSAALQRRLEHAIGNRFGICANVRFDYLAHWLWTCVGGAFEVPEQSPFAPERLVWRCYRWLESRAAKAGTDGANKPDDAADADLERDSVLAGRDRESARAHGRLGAYLQSADAEMRYELASRVAELMSHYLAYRPDWLERWQRGESIFGGKLAQPVKPFDDGFDSARSASNLAPDGGLGDAVRTGLKGSMAQRDDERWQANLWQALLEELGTTAATLPAAAAAVGSARRAGPTNPARTQAGLTPPAYRFIAEAAQFDLARVADAAWPARVSLFALPTMAPLATAMLRELARWIDVHVYVLNPCREFWSDIITPAGAERLEAAGRLDFHQIGNPLLAEWGRQTQAQLHVLQELTQGRAAEAQRFVVNPAPTWLAAVQNAVLDLQALPSPPVPPIANGIEVHVCHSLSRQLEVLHDRLLNLFEHHPDLQPADVLVCLPDLALAAPLIDAVFGTAALSDARRIPYRVTGLAASQANPVARTLLELLTLPSRTVGVADLIEWLRLDALAARYGIDPLELETLQQWLALAGARRGFAPPEPGAASFEGVAAGVPGVPTPRHTFDDALTRLLLGYAMPDGALPLAEWLPVAGASGSRATLLGRLARVLDDLAEFAERCAHAGTPAVWRNVLLDGLQRFFDAGSRFAHEVADTRAAIEQLCLAMQEGAPAEAIEAGVVRAALGQAMDHSARGGVASGAVTFAAPAAMRGMPFKVVCLLGMDDGVMPGVTRADEFDLIAAFGRLGDRERRNDERNLFLDLVLAARETVLIAYTGRSIRDNSALPPAALVDELLDYCATAVAGAAANPAQHTQARAGFVVEHPLQAFAAAYFDSPTEALSYDLERAELAQILALRDAGGPDPAIPFFTQALSPEPVGPIEFASFERFWRHPVRALLRDRLGIVWRDAVAELSDLEPFEIDYAARDALVARVLPSLFEATAHDQAAPRNAILKARAQALSVASHELPGGATGAVRRAHEFAALERLSQTARRSLGADHAPLPFALEIEPVWPHGLEHPWPLAGDLAGLQADALSPATLIGELRYVTPANLVIFRYSSARPGDYLGAWLQHLVYQAVCPGQAGSTVWIGASGGFEFAPVAAPLQHLAELIALYRVGRRVPLKFFPKTSWAKIVKGDAQARSTWIDERTGGEATDAAMRIGLRGGAAPLDAIFASLAQIVIEPLRAHVRESV